MSVRYIEKIAEHLHFFSLLAFAHQITHRNAQELSEQIHHGALYGPFTLYNIFELTDIQRLDAFAIVIRSRICQLMDFLQHFPVLGNLLSLNQGLHRVQAVAGVIAAVNLADARMARRILQNNQISRKHRCMRAGQRHQHTVISRNGNYCHLGNDRCRSKCTHRQLPSRL